MRLFARFVSAFALLVAALVLTGCGPKSIVLKQASPNAMTPASKFVIERASFDPNFRVGEKTEQEWMGEKKPETRDKWDGDKVAMSDGFVDGFMVERESILVDSAPGAGVFSVRARYTNYDPGYYAVIAAAPTVLDAHVEFLDGSGQPVDVIRIRVKNGAYSAGQGARACSKEIGAITAKYLKQRLGL